MTAPLSYFTLPECGTQKFFACQRLSATLSVASCSKMWTEANEKAAERHWRCRGCETGASHAGRHGASTSGLRGSMVCSRCHRGATRLIGKWLCVSCFNRQREFVSGRNAKGAPPSRMLPLHRRSVAVVLPDGSVTRFERPLSQSTDELVVGLLRDSPHRVTLAFSARGPL